jgi:hypothetical protein
MRGESQPGARAGSGSPDLRRRGSDLERRYPWALALYAVLAVLVWFTMGDGKVLVGTKPVELRLFPLVILGGLALRTVLAIQAEKIRRGGEDEGGKGESGSQSPRS